MRELRERAEPALRIFCLILAGVVLYELAGIAIRWNPFRGVTVPELPALTSATNAPPGGAHGTNQMTAAVAKGTNGAPRPSSTNVVAVASASSNSISAALPAGKGTNPIALAEAPMTSTNVATNVVAGSASNTVAGAVISAATNTVTDAAANPATNASAQIEVKPAATNAMAVTMLSTNGGTNLLLSSKAADTNNASDSKPKRKRSGNESPPDMGGMGFNSSQGPAKRADLPPALQARITRITDSEILGQVMHPMPMALLGIAGDCAFLRSDSGQTGLVKQGDTLADLKLIRIGVNRVLIEQAGQKKELTIFDGYGGDSLLPNDSTNENKHL